MLSHLAILIAAQSAPAAAAASPQHDVVVTARPLADTARALEQCIARHCRPDEDVQASLAHAENQFVAGDYRSARRTLLAARGRDRRFARQYPVPVSDLLRAGSRIAAHLGETRDYQIETIDTLDALRAGLPASDARVLEQRIEVADMFVTVGRFDAATPIYADVERAAHRLGLAVLEGAAALRPATIVLRSGAAPPDARRDALRSLDRLAADPRPAMASSAMVARVVRAQYQARQGDSRPLDALIADLRRREANVAPVLVFAPPIDLAGPPRATTSTDNGPPVRDILSRLPVGSFDHQWIDVSFWVRPDGTVGDVDVTRQSVPTVAEWDRPVLTSIAQRRYLPLSLPPGDPGVLRVERYTYTSSFDDTATYTRIRVRDGAPRLEMLDLTLDDARGRGRPTS
jgi:hypothetical protein